MRTVRTRGSWRNRSRTRAVCRCRKSRKRRPRRRKNFFGLGRWRNRAFRISFAASTAVAMRASRRFLRNAAGHCASRRHQRSRATNGPARKGKPGRDLSGLDFEIRTRRLSRQLGHAARQTGNRDKNRRWRAARRGFQRSSPHGRSDSGRCAGARSDRHANSVAARPGTAKCERFRRYIYIHGTPEERNIGGRSVTVACACARATSFSFTISSASAPKSRSSIATCIRSIRTILPPGGVVAQMKEPFAGVIARWQCAVSLVNRSALALLLRQIAEMFSRVRA